MPEGPHYRLHRTSLGPGIYRLLVQRSASRFDSSINGRGSELKDAPKHLTMHEPDRLIRTKLRLPFIRSGLIPRLRLQEQVLRGLRGPLTLITAPAGFGKTTLAASCITGCGMPVAWLSLEKDDNRAGRVLNYLIAALHEADDAIGVEALQMLAASPEVPAEAILTSLINELDTAPSDLALVLDDYHVITSPSVHEAVSFLLRHQPQTLHLLIATRSDPPLPLANLRARGQTVELRAADLRFTMAEGAAFLNDVMGLHLDAKSISVLEDRTEGWIAGLQMAALSMRNREDIAGFIEGFSGSQRYVLDYLLGEVLNVQTAEVQRFLLFTSILDRLSPSLCDVLLQDCAVGDSANESPAAECRPIQSGPQSILQYLERANLFVVPLDDEGVWYRYHHLFADLLRARLDQLYPGLSPRLHARAAVWLEQAGLIVEAVNHTLSAGEYDRAARLVEENTTRLLAQGELNALMAWIDMLPSELRSARPWLCVHQAYALLFAGRTLEVAPLLAQVDASLQMAREHVATTPATTVVEERTLPGAVMAVRAFTAALTVGGNEAITQAERAGQLVAADDLFSQSLVAWALGYALHREGRLSAARSAFEEQIRLSRTMRNHATLMIGVTALARVLADQGELRQARALLEGALVEAQQASPRNMGFITRVQAHLGALLCQQNELEAAHPLLSAALDRSRLWRNPNHSASIFIYLTRVLIAQGDMQAARNSIEEADRVRMSGRLSEWLRRGVEAEIVRAQLAFQCAGFGLAPHDPLTEHSNAILASWRSELADMAEKPDAPMSQQLELVRLTLARAAYAAGQLDEALGLLEPVIRSAMAAGHTDMAIQCLVLNAIALQGRHVNGAGSALSNLQEALALAEPGGYVRVFLSEGEPMRMLLAQWLAHATGGALRKYAMHLLPAFETPVRAAPAAPQNTLPGGEVIEPLSHRELEVLQLLALGKTNQEIARELIVAPGTVKAHAASIYRKLDVANRTEAVARGRALGLLS